MRKLLAIILLICVMTSCLSGCVISLDDTTRPVNNDNINNTQPDPENGEGTKPSNDATEPPVSKDVTVEETVLYDQNDVKITLKSMSEGWLGMEFKLLVENNTSHNIVLSAGLFVVNGITVSGSAYIDVAAGKKSNDELVFYTSELEQAGITTISTVKAVDAYVFDSDTYETMFDTPMEFATSAVGYVQQIDDSGDVLMQEAGVTVTAKYITDDIFGEALLLCVRNETGKDIVLTAENVSVNDYTVTAWLYEKIIDGTVRYSTMYLFSSEMEKNDIDVVETIAFNLEVINANTYDRIAESDEILVRVGN